MATAFCRSMSCEGMGGVEAKASLDELMAIVAAPAGETFEDLVPKGAGCKIAKTEERAIRLSQLRAVKAHVERRCAKEGWLDYQGTALLPDCVSLYEVWPSPAAATHRATAERSHGAARRPPRTPRCAPRAWHTSPRRRAAT